MATSVHEAYLDQATALLTRIRDEEGEGIHDMYARKAASEGIVYIYKAYEICFIKTSFTLIIVYHFLLQYFHLPFFLRSSRDL